MVSVQIDPDRREKALYGADMKRSEAADLMQQARALISAAEVIERTWQIPPPCHLCGRRECGH